MWFTITNRCRYLAVFFSHLVHFPSWNLPPNLFHILSCRTALPHPPGPHPHGSDNSSSGSTSSSSSSITSDNDTGDNNRTDPSAWGTIKCWVGMSQKCQISNNADEEGGDVNGTSAPAGATNWGIIGMAVGATVLVAAIAGFLLKVCRHNVNEDSLNFLFLPTISTHSPFCTH